MGRKTVAPYLGSYALHAPPRYNAKSGPYPLIICIPAVDEKPEDHLRDHWAEAGVRNGAIVMALTMPENVEACGSRFVVAGAGGGSRGSAEGLVG